MTFTASDVIALAAIIVGPIVTLWAGLKIQERQTTNAAEMARRARIQANRQETYVDILEQTFRIQDLVDRTAPTFKMSGDPDPPPPMPDDALRRLNARTAAFGSRDMLDSLKAYMGLVREWSAAAWMLENMRTTGAALTQSPSAKNLVDYWRELEEKRTAVRAAFAELSELANRELTE